MNVVVLKFSLLLFFHIHFYSIEMNVEKTKVMRNSKQPFTSNFFLKGTVYKSEPTPYKVISPCLHTKLRSSRVK